MRHKTFKFKPDVVASSLLHQPISFTRKTNALFASTRKRRNKRDDLCNHNKCVNPDMQLLGIAQLKRIDMPQFKTIAAIQSFVKQLKSMGIHVKHGRMKLPISSLLPSQREIRRSKVTSILAHWKPHILSSYHAHDPPIFTSNTGTVIDGHHRSEALRMALRLHHVPNAKITVYAIHMPAWVAIGLANKLGFNRNPQSF